MRTLIIISALLFSLPASAQMQMLFGRNVGAGITSPLDVDSLFYWFDAGQGVFDSVGNIISNFQGVGEWKDLSGNGYHVTQTTNGARPQYLSTGGPNNRPALYFDGTNDGLGTSNHLWESDDITVFVVCNSNRPTLDELETIIFKGTATVNKRQFAVFAGGTTVGINYGMHLRPYRTGGITNFVSYQDGLKENSNRIWAFVSDGTGTATITKDGTPQSVGTVTSGTASGEILNADDTPLGIGIANFGTSNNALFQGYISEIIVYSRAVTTAEREAIENYLNKKYNLY